MYHHLINLVYLNSQATSVGSVPFKNSEEVIVEVADGIQTIEGNLIEGIDFSFSLRKALTPKQEAEDE